MLTATFSCGAVLLYLCMGLPNPLFHAPDFRPAFVSSAVNLQGYIACCRSGGAHSSNMAKLANAPKLDGLDVTLFSRAPPEARPRAFVYSCLALSGSIEFACSGPQAAEYLSAVLRPGSMCHSRTDL